MDRALSLSVASPTPTLRPRARLAGESARRLLVVGSGRRAADLVRALRIHAVGTIVACIDARPQMPVPAQIPDVPMMRGLGLLAALVLEEGIDEIFVALPLRSCFDECRLVEVVGRELGVPVHFDVLWPEVVRTRLMRTANSMMLTCHEHPSSRLWASACKRTVDVSGAIVALVLTAPLLIAVAALVKVSSPGPILFSQPRVGRHRRVFHMLKFRTMVADAEARRSSVQACNDAKGIMFKVSRDPRVTGIGRWLRKTSIDELPQLLNVLKGDMSLVGPRPIPTWVFDQADEPGFHRRFAVRSGMTGLWQVNGREQHYSLMARYDLAYVDQWSLWLDFKILWRTLPVVLQGRGAS